MLSLLEQVSSVLSILLCGTFSASLGYFYCQKKTKQERAEVVGTAVGGSFLLGAAAGLICWPAAGPLAREVFRSHEAVRYLPIVFICMPFSFGLEALLGWLRIEDEQLVFARASLLRIALTAAGIALLVGVLKMHVMAYLSTTLATTIVITAALVAYLTRRLHPVISFSLLVPMLRFSIPLWLSLMAMFVINFGDQFVLRHYRPLAEVGIYALAYKIGMVVSGPYSSLHAYWAAQVYRILSMKDADAVFARLFTYAVLLVSSVALGLTLVSTPGLRILVAPGFQGAAPLIPMIAGAYAIRSIGEFLRCRFLAAGRPGYEAGCTWAGMVICVALYVILIPRYGMWGGAIATSGTFVVMGVFSVVATYRVRPYRVEGVRLLKLGGVLAATLLLYYTVPVSTLALQIGWSTLLLGLFSAGLVAVRFPTPGEWAALRLAARRIVGWRRDATSVAG
jgi:O-antigen/teichoic acid export membrane protein